MSSMRLCTCLLVFYLGTTLQSADAKEAPAYFPPPDTQGGWRTVKDAEHARSVAGMDVAALDRAYEFTQRTTKNGGLLVARRGWLVYERYFGRGHHEATTNLASCGKSFTSVAVGIQLHERPELFPEGLDTKVFMPRYFPAEAFPLSDPRKTDIKLGQLLAFTAGIRGNNPCHVDGKETAIDPPGPDGWPAMTDDIALGRSDTTSGKRRFSAATLWCEPGGGYSYASSSIHMASIMLRHVTGEELQEHVRKNLAEPMGWGRWGFGYKSQRKDDHTPGGGGIVLRPTDMLRFGHLLLHEGRWGDRQLIPADFVRHCARPSPYNPHFGYSLQFDVNGNGHWPDAPLDAFWKSGSGGHLICVVPSLELVIWKLGGRDGQYSPGDTGLAVHPDAAKAVDDRKDWKEDPALDYETAKRQTIKLVLDAVIGQDSPND